jgi:anti-anti-sigma regulatory factor
MAKYRHRTFEMYDFRLEAIEALTPKSTRFDADSSNPDDWQFEVLNVSLADNVTSVTFKESAFSDSQTELNLRNDFSELANKLTNNSKVLLDFSGLESFSPAAIEAVVVLNKKLQNKGSRIALCNLAPNVKAAFFPAART